MSVIRPDLSLHDFLITARGWPPSFRVSELFFPLHNSEYLTNAHVKLPEGSEVLQWRNYGRHSRRNLLQCKRNSRYTRYYTSSLPTF